MVGASDHTVTHSLYIEDPDGNEIELYVDVPGVDWDNNPELVASPIKASEALSCDAPAGGDARVGPSGILDTANRTWSSPQT